MYFSLSTIPSCSRFCHFSTIFHSLEMCSSITIEHATQLQYYVVRDTLLGRNSLKKDVKRALELASACQHPEAQWLSKIFARKDVKTGEEAREVFLAHETDPRALCFAALLVWPWDDDSLRRSAEMGFAFAQAHDAGTTHEERFSLSLRASLQGERDGFYSLGWCYVPGHGCEQDLIKAKDNLLLAAQLNHVEAMVPYGKLLDDSDPQRWHWLGLAASRGATSSFLSKFGSVVDRAVTSIRSMNSSRLAPNSIENSARILPSNSTKVMSHAA